MCLALCGQKVLVLTAVDADSADNAFTMSSAGYAYMLVKGVICASFSFSGGTNSQLTLCTNTTNFNPDKSLGFYSCML